MLRLTTEELYKQELEFYSHMVTDGDLTLLTFELLKNTRDMPRLLKYLGYQEEKQEQEEKKTIKTFEEMFKESVEVH